MPDLNVKLWFKKDPGQVQKTTKISTWRDKDLFRPSYNVAPTRYQPIIRRDREDPDHPKLLQSMKWGLIPSWNKTMPDYTFTMRTINARDDKVKEAKSMWSGVKQTKRCVVIAEGFYEWLKKGKEKQPYFVQWEDNRLMCFAGLYDHAVIDGQDIWSYTIITTSSSKALSFLHDRMPVLLRNEDEVNTWLDPNLRFTDEVAKLLRSTEEGLKWYPVSSYVSKVGNDGVECLKPAGGSTKGGIAAFFKKPELKEEKVEQSRLSSKKPGLKEEKVVQSHLSPRKPGPEEEKVEHSHLSPRKPGPEKGKAEESILPSEADHNEEAFQNDLELALKLSAEEAAQGSLEKQELDGDVSEDASFGKRKREGPDDPTRHEAKRHAAGKGDGNQNRKTPKKSKPAAAGESNAGASITSFFKPLNSK